MPHIIALSVLILFAILTLLMAAICLFTPAVYSHAKPKTKKKVIELTCDGWLARKFLLANWGASTIPLPFIVLILYWVHDSASEKPHPAVRVHEFVHVAQDERNAFFLVSWLGYFRELISKRARLAKSWMQAYQMNKYEVEAYEVEKKCILGETPFPDWA